MNSKNNCILNRLRDKTIELPGIGEATIKGVRVARDILEILNWMLFEMGN